MVSETRLDRLAIIRGRVNLALQATEQLAPIGASELFDELSAAVEELDAAADALMEADRDIAREHQRYRDLFDLAPDGYLVSDVEGVVLEANLAASIMLRVAHQELIGKPLAVYLGDGDAGGLHRLLDAAADDRQRRALDWEAVIRPRSGHRLHVWIRVQADRGDGGRPSALRILIRDISERVRAADLERRDRSRLQSHAERLEALEQVKADLLRLVSHELGTPVAVIRGYVSMMADGSLGEVGDRVKAVLPILTRRCDEMARLVEQMLEITRLQEARPQLARRRVDLGEIVADAVTQMMPQAEMSGRRLALIRPSGPIPVFADPARVDTILSNLMGNALKYSGEGSEVICEVLLDGGSALAVVRDHGPGIAGDQLGRLFTKFGRVVTPETSHIRGTGLGLYLSRELARLLGGDIRAQSVEGVGSSFTLSLPVAPTLVPGGEPAGAE